jgi:hypothetical protein
MSTLGRPFDFSDKAGVGASAIAASHMIALLFGKALASVTRHVRHVFPNAISASSILSITRIPTRTASS